MPEISESDLKELQEKAASADDFQSQLTKVKGKNDELIGEKRKAQAAKDEAEEKARLEAEEKNVATNNYKELHASSEEQRGKLQGQLDELKGKTAKDQCENAAQKLSAKLADGENVGLLAEFVTKRLKSTDDGIKVLDKDGHQTVSSLDDLAKEIEGDPRFASLLKGNQSNGGGAGGGDDKNSGGAAKTKTRAEFDAMSQPERSKFSTSGGTVID